MHSSQILENLTDRQREAVQHIEGPLLMLAGPGSGKTRVVTHRIAHLLQQGISPSRIVALTFTNKAANEMMARLQQLAPNQQVWSGTFHGFCARLLRRHAQLVGLSENFTIYDTTDQVRALKQALEGSRVELAHFTLQQVHNKISWAKNQLYTYDTWLPRPGDPLGAITAQVYPLYQRRLLQSNAVDFDDLLLYAVILLRDHSELRRMLDERFQYIMVDEYQDTNLAQYALVRLLSVDAPNLAVTGDPDQSIYSWRGANLSNILEFEKDFEKVKVVRLEQNYRSTQRILSAADQLISHNRRRKKKALYTDNALGSPVRLVTYASQREEANGIADQIAQDIEGGSLHPGQIAIFYRMNALSRPLEDALRTREIPYQVVCGHEFYQRKEIKDLLAYLHLLNNPRADVAFERIVNVPPRKIGKRTVDRLREHANRSDQSMLTSAREAGMIETVPKRSAAHVAKFVALYDHLASVVSNSVEEILGLVISQTGYRDMLLEMDAADEQDRVANLDELLSAAREFDEQHPDDGGLETYLEQAALISDADGRDEAAEKVTLMTLHAAKGLEFPAVYIVALESNILPHHRSMDDPDQLEEERRLLFVGMTRAEQLLQLSRATKRSARGRDMPAIASQFLFELPREEMDVIEPAHTWPTLSHEPVPPSCEPSTPASDNFLEKAKLVTADQLLGEPLETPPAVSVEQYEHGMLVNHPQYGSGIVITLGGLGSKRTATVRFFDGSERKFRLAHCSLRPIRS